MSCLDNVKKKTVRNLVICAMVSLKHIVTPDYIEQFVKYLKGEVSEPNPERYLPNISEAQIDPTEVSFKRNPKRSSVFKGMTFIFLNAKQYKKMNMAVELGGGMSMLMEDNTGDDDDSVLIQKGTVVMNCMVDSSTQSQMEQGWIQHVQKYLKKHKKHMIQDAELGYAVLFCSTEKHCNPDNDFLSQIMSKIPSQSLSQADILAANTEPTQTRSLLPRRRHVTNDPDTIDETKLAADPGNKKSDTSTDSKGEPSSPGQSKHTVLLSPSDNQKRSSKRTPSPKPNFKKSLSPQQKSSSPIPETSRKTRSKSRSPSPNPPTRKTRSKSRSPSPVPLSDIQRRSRSRSPAPSSRKQVEPEVSIRRKVNAASDKDDSEIPFGRTIKQEIVTPTKSPAKTGRNRNIDIDTEIKSEMKWLGNSKNDSNDNPKKLNTNVSQRQKQSVFDSVQLASQQKEEHETRSHKKKVEKFDDSDDEKPKKKRKYFGDSDEDLVEITKRKRRQEAEDDDNDFFAPKRKTQTKQNGIDKKKENKTNKGVYDTEGNESVRNTTWLNKELDEVDNPRAETFDQMEQEHSTNRQAEVKRETSFGFLTTVIPIKDQVCKTEYEKENDLPSNCVVTEFVPLLSKKKKTTIREEDNGDVPAGYLKWKGKLVKNFKKFKKTGHAGSNELPRIIGGSDLEAHIASERKEIDEWFRDALEMGTFTQ
ncbi:hypothetical protein KUTeg_010000 [Tegillarca granosa]|uniref:Nibrin C-terminal domain-containing protein n=1 Tax=Tegillarca granosa TaxID=220873 RepID=A0ABQ9F9U4_TEGGR|nr:hypothetical protein KUTeg_010000 [Tegillarca granosa]